MRLCAAFPGALIGALLAAAPSVAAPLRGPVPHRTGRYLVAFERASTVRSSSALDAVLNRARVRRAGRGVPELGIATVRGSDQALRRLRRDPSVESVSPEYFRTLRRVPTDPTVSTPETVEGGLPGGAPIQWALGREGFPGAWDVTTGAGAVVAVIDSGIDGAHPELAGKIASADAVGTTSPRTDADGHGTHAAGLACAATNDGIAVAGAGWDCRLAVVKATQTDILRDQDIIQGIRVAVDRGAQAVNMSFGGGGESAALSSAIDYAVARGVVLVAAASNDPLTDQGAPASQIQPNDAPNIDAGRGLVVTAANFGDANAGTGRGAQISVAAYGFANPSGGPPGLISTYPGNATPNETGCGIPVFVCIRRDLGGDSRYAYLEGTSIATPQVAALAALVANLNPWLGLHDKLRLIKETARRAGGWTPELGWGIIDAGRAVDAARRVDRLAPRSRLRARRRVRVRGGQRRAAVRLRWSAVDAAGRPGLIPSGLSSFDVYMKRGRGRYRRIKRGTRRRSLVVRLRPGVYRFYTVALDRAGNREPGPRRADVRLIVRR